MVLFFHAGFGWMGGGYVGVADGRPVARLLQTV
jgi:hypothetical protein